MYLQSAHFTHRVHVPGLNQRPSDIPLLARELLRRAARDTPDWLGRFLENGDPARPRIHDGPPPCELARVGVMAW